MLKVFWASTALADYVCGTTDDDGNPVINPVLPDPAETQDPWTAAGWNYGGANDSATLRRWSMDFSQVVIDAIQSFVLVPPIAGEPCGYFECENVAEANALIPNWNS